MLPHSKAYARRLMRMRTLAADFRLTAEGDDKDFVGAGVGVGVGVRGGAERRNTRLDQAEAFMSSGYKKYTTGSLWMRKPEKRASNRRRQPAGWDPEHQWQQMTQSESPMTRPDRQTNNSKREQPERSASATASSGLRRSHRSGVYSNANSNAQQPTGQQQQQSEPNASDIEFPGMLSEASEPELQKSNFGYFDEVLNENAVAKGANALVKQATSRQTEIIDTSKLLEEGKVETQYEEPEDEPEEIEETDFKLIDEYEKTFEYARRLRALLNMKFKVVDKNSIETNFLLVKAHEHPTQRVLDRWRNVDLGQPYDNQIRQKKLVDDFKALCGQKKKPKKGEVRIPIYPEWLKFHFRFKKDASEKRWADFTAYRQRMKKLTGGKVTVPKANDRYLPAYYDVWSTSVVLFAKPETTLLNMIDPLFSKLGLDARADFKFTVGCFVGDKRSGKSKVQGAPSTPEEITMQVLCGDLYKRNCSEVFVNDNRIEMFQAFPSYYSDGMGDKKSQGSAGSGKKGKKDKKDKKAGKNQSNLTERRTMTSDAQLTLMRRVRHNGSQQQHQQLLATSEDASRRQEGGDTVTAASALEAAEAANKRHQAASAASAAATAAAAAAAVAAATEPETEATVADADADEMAAAFDSSPSATNQNMSVHDCDSSDESQATVEEVISTTKSGKTETTRKD